MQVVSRRIAHVTTQKVPCDDIDLDEHAIRLEPVTSRA